MSANEYAPVTVTFTGDDARAIRRYAKGRGVAVNVAAEAACEGIVHIRRYSLSYPKIEGWERYLSSPDVFPPYAEQWVVDGEDLWPHMPYRGLWCVFYLKSNNYARPHPHLRRFGTEYEAQAWASALDSTKATLLAVLEEEW